MTVLTCEIRILLPLPETDAPGFAARAVLGTELLRKVSDKIEVLVRENGGSIVVDDVRIHS